MAEGGQDRLQESLRTNPRPRPEQPHRWSLAADLLVRGIIALLVVLVMMHTFSVGRPQLEVDLYGRVLEDWGYAPALGSIGPGGAGGPFHEKRDQHGRGTMVPGAGATPGEDGGRPPGDPRAQAVVTLAYEGSGRLHVRLNGVQLHPVAPGRPQPLALRPGDRVALWVQEGAGRVRVLYSSPGLVAPRTGQVWPVADEPWDLELRWASP